MMLTAGAKAAYAYDPRTGREIWRVRYNAWSAAPAPVYREGLAFLITGFGGKTELLAVRVNGQGDVTDTHVAWRTDKMVSKTASPVLVGDRIYLADKEGLFHIFKAGAQFEAIADIAMGEPVHATPAYLDGRIYIRTQKQLVCVEKKE